MIQRLIEGVYTRGTQKKGSVNMGRRLPDQVAIVTGAGSVGPGWGNGKATAVLFAREGASVFAVDINLAPPRKRGRS